MSGVQAMKRIPRIKFPQRHLKLSGSTPQPEAGGEADTTFFSNLKAPKTVGGKASVQPKRTPVSKEEVDAILLGGCF